MTLTLPATLIKTALRQPLTTMAERVDLDLPNTRTTFPFRCQQQEALNLALSNSPIAAIAGIPGSGKTQVILAAMEAVIDQQKSILVVAGKKRSLKAYANLPLPPLEMIDNIDYQDCVYRWVKQHLSNPKLTFCPSYWLPDPLFEKLIDILSRRQWLQYLQSDQQEEITALVAQELPDVHPARRQLLIYRLCKAYPLLVQREQIRQNYTHLSTHALQDITDGLIATITIPVLCVSQQLASLGHKVFDWVVVEDAHILKPEIILDIAHRAKKLVLLGELEHEQSSFSDLFSRLWPGDRVLLTENHRLHPDLAYSIFSSFYPSIPVPYTPPTRSYDSLPKELPRLAWYDVVADEKLTRVLWKHIQSIPNCHHSILTFSSKLANQLRLEQKQIFMNHALESKVEIYDIDNWYGNAHPILWIVCDSTTGDNTSSTDIRWAFTRATESIGVIGDKTRCKHKQLVLNSLFYSSLTVIRNIDL